MIVGQSNLCAVALEAADMSGADGPVKGVVLVGPPAVEALSIDKPQESIDKVWRLVGSPLGGALFRFARRKSFLSSFSKKNLFADPSQASEPPRCVRTARARLPRRRRTPAPAALTASRPRTAGCRLAPRRAAMRLWWHTSREATRRRAEPRPRARAPRAAPARRLAGGRRVPGDLRRGRARRLVAPRRLLVRGGHVAHAAARAEAEPHARPV